MNMHTTFIESYKTCCLVLGHRQNPISSKMVGAQCLILQSGEIETVKEKTICKER